MPGDGRESQQRVLRSDRQKLARQWANLTSERGKLLKTNPAK
jgi:hypothetical protein